MGKGNLKDADRVNQINTVNEKVSPNDLVKNATAKWGKWGLPIGRIRKKENMEGKLASQRSCNRLFEFPCKMK